LMADHHISPAGKQGRGRIFRDLKPRKDDDHGNRGDGLDENDDSARQPKRKKSSGSPGGKGTSRPANSRSPHFQNPVLCGPAATDPTTNVGSEAGGQDKANAPGSGILGNLPDLADDELWPDALMYLNDLRQDGLDTLSLEEAREAAAAVRWIADRYEE